MTPEKIHLTEAVEQLIRREMDVDIAKITGVQPFEVAVTEDYFQWMLGMLKAGNDVFGVAFNKTVSLKSLEEAREKGMDPELIDELEGYLVAAQL